MKSGFRNRCYRVEKLNIVLIDDFVTFRAQCIFCNLLDDNYCLEQKLQEDLTVLSSVKGHTVLHISHISLIDYRSVLCRHNAGFRCTKPDAFSVAVLR